MNYFDIMLPSEIEDKLIESQLDNELKR